ncbi:unnamed protein product [Trichobilharzia szidati]|nr:unnamed protein product [Trichobilharzia szidati]
MNVVFGGKINKNRVYDRKNKRLSNTLNREQSITLSYSNIYHKKTTKLKRIITSFESSALYFAKIFISMGQSDTIKAASKTLNDQIRRTHQCTDRKRNTFTQRNL